MLTPGYTYMQGRIAASSATFNVAVHISNTRKFFTVTKISKVYELKEMVAERFDMLPSEVVLTYSQKLLKDEYSLYEYGIGDGHIINLEWKPTNLNVNAADSAIIFQQQQTQLQQPPSPTLSSFPPSLQPQSMSPQVSEQQREKQRILKATEMPSTPLRQIDEMLSAFAGNSDGESYEQSTDFRFDSDSIHDAVQQDEQKQMASMPTHDFPIPMMGSSIEKKEGDMGHFILPPPGFGRIANEQLILGSSGEQYQQQQQHPWLQQLPSSSTATTIPMQNYVNDNFEVINSNSAQGFNFMNRSIIESAVNPEARHQQQQQDADLLSGLISSGFQEEPVSYHQLRNSTPRQEFHEINPKAEGMESKDASIQVSKSDPSIGSASSLLVSNSDSDNSAAQSPPSLINTAWRTPEQREDPNFNSSELDAMDIYHISMPYVVYSIDFRLQCLLPANTWTPFAEQTPNTRLTTLPSLTTPNLHTFSWPNGEYCVVWSSLNTAAATEPPLRIDNNAVVSEISDDDNNFSEKSSVSPPPSSSSPPASEIPSSDAPEVTTAFSTLLPRQPTSTSLQVGIVWNKNRQHIQYTAAVTFMPLHEVSSSCSETSLQYPLLAEYYAEISSSNSDSSLPSTCSSDASMLSKDSLDSALAASDDGDIPWWPSSPETSSSFSLCDAFKGIIDHFVKPSDEFSSFEEQYQNELKALIDMGYSDTEMNIKALTCSNGNVQEAAEHLERVKKFDGLPERQHEILIEQEQKN